MESGGGGGGESGGGEGEGGEGGGGGSVQAPRTQAETTHAVHTLGSTAVRTATDTPTSTTDVCADSQGFRAHLPHGTDIYRYVPIFTDIYTHTILTPNTLLVPPPAASGHRCGCWCSRGYP